VWRRCFNESITMLVSLFSGFVKALSVAAVIVILLRREIKANILRMVAAGAFCLLLLDLCLIFATPIAFDYRIFWVVGRDLWEGRDPYDPGRFAFNPFLNPPTALPLFALFATARYLPSLVVWTLANVLFCLTLPALAGCALSAQQSLSGSQPAGIGTWRPLPTRVMAALCLMLIVSDVFAAGLLTGQLGLLTALALVAALDAQGRERPILSGAWLGLATIKVSTMLPFLLLFLRKRDVRTWIALGLTCAALCLAGGSPAVLPRRVSWTLNQIGSLSAPGQVNDYSFVGPQSATVIGFDHAMYRLGLRDRTTIHVLQLIVVAMLGLWVASLAWACRLPRAAICSLVALYSVLFFYHRLYDTVVLILPLVYCVSRSQSAEGRCRWWFIASSIAILLVWFMSAIAMKALTQASLSWAHYGRPIQAVVLPYATWMILAAMACIYCGDARNVHPAQHC
jgi:hypothetical protein